MINAMKRAALAAAAILVLGSGAVAALFLYRLQKGHDVQGSSTIEFVTTAPLVPEPASNAILWPMFGFDAERLHFRPGVHMRPPFRTAWVAGGDSLLEFPPAIAYGRLFLSNGSGLLLAIGAKSGRRAWAYKSKRCVASSPAVGDFKRGTVYATFLNRKPCNAQRTDDGEVVALSVGTGELRWRRRLGPSESSPLLANGRVYVGDWLGNVYALDARTGKTVWEYHTGGKIKGAVALGGKRVYVGAYDGWLYALDARTGRLVWRASGDSRLFGHGTFYSTPALAYGRVYIGSTDGKVYSFGATTGKRRWSHHTGGYVYGSPAIWRQLVLIGSYDHTFYAFDAATGNVRWRFKANGPISGSATVVGGVVYFATLKGRTYGLDAATGSQLWSFPDGKYSPVVADKHRLYLVGYGKLYGFTPH